MLRNFRTTRRSRRLPARVRAAEIQALEPRTLPAGIVTASFASNLLTLTGDGKGNDVVVDVVGTDTGVQLRVTGIHGTSVKVGSEISGSDESVPFNPTSVFGIVVSLGGGSDSIEVDVASGLGTRTLTKLDINTGDEADRIEVALGAGTNLNFTDVVSLKTGEDFDMVNVVLLGSVSMAKTLTVDTGLDSDQANISVGLDATLTVTGATVFNLSDGEDELQFSGEGTVAFNNTLTINAGEDSDEVLFDLDKGLTVKGATTINLLDGDDTVSFLHTSSTIDFQAGVTINLGSGDDHVFFNAEEEVEVIPVVEVTLEFGNGTLRAAGSTGLTITGGSGSDHVEIIERLVLPGGLNLNLGDGADEVHIDTGVGTIVEGVAANSIGKLTIDTGDDADDVEFHVFEGTSLAVSGAALFNTGKGNDLIEFFSELTVTTFAAGLTIDTGATSSTQSGSDHIDLGSGLAEGGKIGVTGAVKIATGGGADYVSIDSTLAVSGDLNIDTGSGNDLLNLYLQESPTPVADGVAHNTLGSITINSGSGSDFVEIYTSPEATTRVSGIVSITTGTGADEVWVDTEADLTIVKDLKIDTGAGDDFVFVEVIAGAFQVNGNQSVNLGDDDDCFVQGQSDALDDFRNPEGSFFGESDPDATLQVDLNVTILGGGGDDFIGLDLMQIGKNKPTPTSAFPASVTTIDSGAGSDLVAIDDVILRDLKVLAGADDDFVYARDLTVRGTTNIDLGAGGDELAVTGATSLGDNVTLLGGAGDDDFMIDEDVTLATGKKINLNGGAGEDDILANLSAISDTDLNPAPPPGIETLNGVFGIEGIVDLVDDFFAGCIANFEEDFIPG